MPSKMVIDRQRSSIVVERAAEVFGPEATEKLLPLLRGGLEPGEEPPDLLRPTLLLGKSLERRRVRMVEADVAHDKGLRIDLVLRQRRDQALADLRTRLIEVRTLLDASYGQFGAVAQAGIDKLPFREPVGLLRQADDVLTALREPNTVAAIDTAPLTGVSLDRAAMVEVIEAPRRALVEFLDAINTEKRKLTASFATKSEAVAAYDAAFGQVSRVLEALFEAAGMPLVAARVRPSSRRPGRTNEDVESPPSDSPPAPGGETDTSAPPAPGTPAGGGTPPAVN